VCKLDGSACAVVTTAVEKPRGVAIHVAQKLLVFSDWGSRPQIVRMGLDGAESKAIVQDNLRWPNGIAVDQVGFSFIFFYSSVPYQYSELLGIPVII
jgi:hypothetical protein